MMKWASVHESLCYISTLISLECANLPCLPLKLFIICPMKKFKTTNRMRASLTARYIPAPYLGKTVWCTWLKVHLKHFYFIEFLVILCFISGFFYIVPWCDSYLSPSSCFHVALCYVFNIQDYTVFASVNLLSGWAVILNLLQFCHRLIPG